MQVNNMEYAISFDKANVDMQVNNMEYAISFDKAFFDVKRYETEHIIFKSIFILYNLKNILIIIFLKILHTFLKFYVVLFSISFLIF